MAALGRNMAGMLRAAATLAVVAVAAALAWFAWQHYVYAPWTRDARVQADVINIAAEVSGTVTQVAVADNSYVHKGQLLFRIQPVRFRNALAEARATLASARAQAHYEMLKAQRLQALPSASVSTQDRQQAQAKAASSSAAVREAQAKLAQAKQDLAWATVRSPVNGYVTHLLLDEGDYAASGHSVMTLVDAETFRVVAYFEETKLPRIRVGDAAQIQLMAGDRRLPGHVVSIAHGIAVPDDASGERNLANVNPTFQWVRLAQRVPVTIAFDHRPNNLRLSVGLTATVHIRSGHADPDTSQSSPLRLSPAQPLDDAGAPAADVGTAGQFR